jgi:hypothetical protein
MFESGAGARANPGFLMVDALNPVDGLGIADFAQVSLTGLSIVFLNFRRFIQKIQWVTP